MISDTQTLTGHLPTGTRKGDHLGVRDFGSQSSSLLLNTLSVLTTRLLSPKMACLWSRGKQQTQLLGCGERSWTADQAAAEAVENSSKSQFRIWIFDQFTILPNKRTLAKTGIVTDCSHSTERGTTTADSTQIERETSLSSLVSSLNQS